MTPDRWPQIESLFHAALECAAESRAAFLAEACAGDDELREQVAALLAHDRTDASFIEAPAIQVAAQRLAREGGEAEIPTASLEGHDSADTPGRSGAAGQALSAGSLVGNFRIVRQIGAGGMGEVYLAEDLKLGRRVALKMLPSALAPDDRARRRFTREARAASALNHPNIVTIYDIVEAEGLTFIVMEYIGGESLRERLTRGPLPLAEVATLGMQVAEAIGAAHAINIVHRDLKPGNILITSTGRAKIVDFGLAKAAGAAGAGIEGGAAALPGAVVEGLWASFSLAGSIAGTAPYMSPEQTRGEHLDARSDIFSLGCVLYEASTGQRPFHGPTVTETIQEIRTADPPPPSALAPGLPREFDRIVLRALAKNKEQRYASAVELAAALRRFSKRQARRRWAKRLGPPLAAALMVLALLAAWSWRRENNLRWAKENVGRIEELARTEQFFEAYDLAQEVEKYLSDDPALVEWKPFVTETLSLTTDPPGAAVYLRRFQRDASGEFRPREFLGTTPIQHREIARGDYLLMIEKDGYAPVMRSLSNALDRLERGIWIPGAMRVGAVNHTPQGYEVVADSYAPIDLHVTLIEASRAPPRMVFVPGGEYQLVGGGRPTNAAVQLDDYFIDQFEVANREYQEFVDAGGYQNRVFWKHPFVKDARELSWEEGMALLTDRTGKPGPRGWREQRYPAGQGDHPVTGVTWYEAAAYAEFRGKSLPTVFQWEKAARGGKRTVLWGRMMPWGYTENFNPRLEDRANFYGRGTAPVESFEFGVSPYGCYHMAGNVAEWCRNARPKGFTATGASFREGPNLFPAFGQFPGFYSSESLGFRCVLNLPGAQGDQGGFALPDPDIIPKFEPVSPEAFRLMRSHYDYDPKPLDAKILEDVETDLWRRLKISYVGAAGQRTDGPVPEAKRALAYLWLPKNAPRPLQVVNYKPGRASYQGMTVPQETEMVCKPFLLSGRAVFVAVIEDMTERPLPADWRTPERGSVAYRDMMAYDTIDQRRGLDYLATRDDIDMNKIVCVALSAGASDLITIAVEERFRGTLLLAAGLGRPAMEGKVIAEANSVNFAPYIQGPKLMIQGRYDESLPFETSAQPLFDLLSEPKELIVCETGHFPPIDQWAPPALEWLDRVLGPVNQTSQSLAEASNQ